MMPGYSSVKKVLLLLLLGLLALPGFAQSPLYQVPERFDFASVTVYLDAEARQLVQTDVDALLKNRSFFNARLERAWMYFPIVEPILAQQGVPEDFKYLMIQESGLVPDALSTSQAVGFWQLKKETAQEFGLRVDDVIDERKHIQQATYAAARYLARNQKQLNNWISTLYSYFQGLGGVSKLLPQDWKGARQLQLNATADRYILRCLAHKMAYGTEIAAYRGGPMQFVPYRFAGGKTFTDVATELGVDEVQLRRYNRWLVGGSTVPTDRPYLMLIPAPNNRLAVIEQKAQQNIPGRNAFVASQTNQPAPRTGVNRPVAMASPRKRSDAEYPRLRRLTASVKDAQREPVWYEINGKKGILSVNGDTPASIARRADMGVCRFVSRNEMDRSDLIATDRVYYVDKKDRRGPIEFHTAAADETLSDVSNRYGVRLTRLLRFNRMQLHDELKAGQVVWLQRSRPLGRPVEIKAVPESTPPPAPVVAEPQLVQQPAPKDEVVPNQPPQVVSEVPIVNSTSPKNNTNSNRVVMVDENGRRLGTEPRGETAISRQQPPAAQPATQPATQPVSPKEVIHVVKPGETFFGLARQYGVTAAELRAANGFTDNPTLSVGQRVRIVRTGGSTPQQQVAAEQERPDTRSYRQMIHVVRPNEKFFEIARRYGVVARDLRDWNGLSDYPETLAPGTELKIRIYSGEVVDYKEPEKAAPAPKVQLTPPAAVSRPAAAPPAPAEVHTVQAGETFYGIARKYNMPPAELARLNGFGTFPQLKIGQKIKVRK